METRLQSSEVRIPRNDSFEFSTNNNKTNVSPIKSAASSQYFKSSFARSLSFTLNSNQSQFNTFNTNQSQSPDFELSFRISKCDTSSPIKEDLDTSPLSPMATTPAPRPTEKQFSVSTMPKRKYISNNNRLLQESKNKSFSSEIEVLRLRKECQHLIESNRRLTSDKTLNSEELNGSSNSVEETLLHTQVESLQWQLKQMYHAVMVEVVRFLDRCHQSLDAIQANQSDRSKSTNHVFGNECGDSNIQTRTSTNSMGRSNGISDVDASKTLSGSYSNFRDYTWRRTPKQPLPSTDHNIELNPDKLSQEAFRLLRTAQNLISLKEPCLSDIQSDSHSFKNFDFNNKTSTIQRKINCRESRLSIQSSTDDSVHSTSSSRNETDEETHHHLPPSSCMMPSHLNRKDFIKSMTNSADDESGFSSMNSFQEIGLPASAFSGSEKSDSAPETIPEDDNNTGDITIKSRSIGKTKHLLPIVHRRWDSAPPIPPKRNLSTYNGDGAPKVLWV